MINKFFNKIKSRFSKAINKLANDSRGIGTIEMVLLIVDNLCTSSTYILS